MPEIHEPPVMIIRVDYHDPNYERHYSMSDFLNCNSAAFYVGKYSSLDSDHYGDCKSQSASSSLKPGDHIKCEDYPASQVSGPAATSNTKTSQPVQTSSPAATSNAKTNQPSNTSVLVNTLIIAPLITIGSSTYTPNPLSAYTISSSSLTLSGPSITVSGTVYPLSPGATKFVVSPASMNAASSIQAGPTTLQPTPATITPGKPSSFTILVSSSAVVIGGTI